SGTRRMADTLAYFYAQAADQPGRYEFLNRERAAALQAGVQQASRPDMRDVFALARELLLAGKTQQAIDILSRLQRATRVTLRSRTPETKQSFDLRAIP